jgi:plastocyanin
MKSQLVYLALLLLMAMLAAFAGCATQQPSPMITITSPQNGATVQAGSVPVTVQVSNFNIVDRQGQANAAGEGHVHFYLDAGTVPQTPGQPAIPSNAQVQWAHVSGTSYTFTGVAPGTHTIAVQLANNVHTPVIPLAYQTVTVTVAGSPTTPLTTTMPPMTTMPPATTSPSATTTMPSGGGNIVQVTLTARNIAFDKSTLTVPAGSTVVMTFVNMDSGVPHNFALYTDLHATTSIFVGDFITGTRTTTYTFTAPSTPGSYFFRCDVHPETMTGTFMVT